MSHNKVYGFCESKCKVEVPTKEQYDNQFELIKSPTYIVDSSQKLKDWANNVAGNDYTDVLIKRGTYDDTVTINLYDTKTIRVTGEIGSYLTNTTIKGMPDSEEASTNVYLLNVNAFKFYKCSNLQYCNTFVKIGSEFEYCFNLSYCKGCFVYCSYLNNCVGLISKILFHYNGTEYVREVRASPFYACDYLRYCRTEETSETSENIVRPEIDKVEELPNYVDESNIIYASFYNCKYVEVCTTTANTYTKYAYRSCAYVWGCNATIGYTTTDEFALFDEVYYYSGPDYNTSSSEVRCSNTVEGGCNEHSNYIK